jgi:lysozyme
VVTFGLDISHHQDLGLSLAAAKRDGIEFVFIKATEGGGFVDPEFRANLDEARAAGQLVAAYHYVRANDAAVVQLANIRRTVPLDVPVIPDVERNSGGVTLTRELVDRARAAGYTVPLLYLPRWYWQELGRPNLNGLPPLWSSRYPDNTVGSLADEWADVPAHYWDGYGGLDVAVLQFTSSSRVAGHQPLDANAFRGNRQQLSTLLGYTQQEDDVSQWILAQEADSDRVWLGNLIHRRHVPDTGTLSDIQHWIRERGGDATVHGPWVNLDALGVDITPQPPEAPESSTLTFKSTP